MHARLLTLLRCPRCGELFDVSVPDRLTCQGCGATFAVRAGIPRLAEAAQGDEIAERTQKSFGYEWSQFHDWTDSGQTNFEDYFHQLDLDTLRGARVLDGGCGMGRHARMLAPHASHLVAVDFSAAIDVAARNTAAMGNVDCVQADLLALPFAPATFDYVYSMGVLHHLRDTQAGVASLVRTLKPGGRLRVYLYWRRPGISGALLSLVSLARRVTTRLPFPILKGLTLSLSGLLWVAVVVPYRVLVRLGFDAPKTLPLFAYTKYSFRILHNDQFDRFSAPLERRFDADEVRRLLESAGLTDVKVLPRFGWIAEGTK